MVHIGSRCGPPIWHQSGAALCTRPACDTKREVERRARPKLLHTDRFQLGLFCHMTHAGHNAWFQRARDIRKRTLINQPRACFIHPRTIIREGIHRRVGQEALCSGRSIRGLSRQMCPVGGKSRIQHPTRKPHHAWLTKTLPPTARCVPVVVILSKPIAP